MTGTSWRAGRRGRRRGTRSSEFWDLGTPPWWFVFRVFCLSVCFRSFLSVSFCLLLPLPPMMINPTIYHKPVLILPFLHLLKRGRLNSVTNEMYHQLRRPPEEREKGGTKRGERQQQKTMGGFRESAHANANSRYVLLTILPLFSSVFPPLLPSRPQVLRRERRPVHEEARRQPPLQIQREPKEVVR